MHKVLIVCNEKEITLSAENGSLLSKILMQNNTPVDHPCGGRGVCEKCSVVVNGKKELSCRYAIFSDIVVSISDRGEIQSLTGAEETSKATENMCLCFDIGTTTLALALVSLDEKRIIRTVTKPNPQRKYAADVISRIDYSVKNGTDKLHEAIITALKEMVDEITKEYGVEKFEKLYVAGNTTMLHLFFNVSCASMGVSPYTPTFLDSKRICGEELGISHIEEVISIEGICAFVGADIVAGLGFAGMPEKRKYNLLIDLGTNAEVALYSENRLLATAAAAGPCFEGVNISCGMTSTEGAIYSYSENGMKVIGDTTPCGICATGLIDIIAKMLESEIVDETGYMECGEYHITDNVSVTQDDVRQFQLAKSAIFSAVEVLMQKAEIGFDDIEHAYISGGFSAKMNWQNAIRTGMFSIMLKDKFKALNNSSLLGCVKYACEKNDLSEFLNNAEYVDLSADELFCDTFIENMLF